MAPQLACGHVLDHALTQRADGAIGTHGELLLSEVLRPRSFLRTGLPAPTMVSSRLATNPRSGTPRSGLSRQRFSALAHFAHSLRCGDRVRLQDYFCRAGEAPARRTIDSLLTKLAIARRPLHWQSTLRFAISPAWRSAHEKGAMETS